MENEKLSELVADGVVWFGERSSDSPAAIKSAPKAVFGDPGIDSLIPEGGLSFGAIHEWALSEDLLPGPLAGSLAPLSVLGSLLHATLDSETGLNLNGKQTILWIGRSTWPTPHLLARIFQNTLFSRKAGLSWKESSIFIDPQNKDKKLWAILKALRSSSALAVVADGSGLNFIASRRLQLAAREGSTLGLIVRPAKELAKPSAARTRWRITPHAAEASQQKASEDKAWLLELQRARGISSPLTWLIKSNTDEEISLGLSSELVGGSAPAPQFSAKPVERKRRQA